MIVKEEKFGRDWEIMNKHRSYCHQLLEFNPNEIITDEVYISIDLDVIGGFPTLWRGRGKLSLEEVINLLNSIAKSKKIEGADICGLELDEINNMICCTLMEN